MSDNEEEKKKENKEKFYEKVFPKKLKKIPIFKAQNVQHTHPGKFVNKFATHIKQNEEKKENSEDFFDNLKDFVDGIELNIGDEKKNNNDFFLTNNQPNNPDPNEKIDKSTEIQKPPQPVLHSNYIKGPKDFQYQNHMNSFIQSLYSKYIRKERKLVSSDRRSNSNVPYDMIHKTKLQNLKMQYQKIFKKAHMYNKDSKVSRFAKSLNGELGRVSNNFGKIESVQNFGDNPKTQFFFDNTNEYLAYKMLKMREEDKKQRLINSD